MLQKGNFSIPKFLYIVYGELLKRDIKMSINTDIVDANLQLLKYKNGLPTTGETQETGQSSLVDEIGMGVLCQVPLVLGINLLGKSKPCSVWQYRNANPNQDGTKLSWSDAWKKVGENREVERNARKYLVDSNSDWQTFKNKRLFSQLKTLEADIPKYDANVDASKLQGKKLTKYNNAVTKNGYYSEVKRLIEEAKTKKLTGKALKEQIQKIHIAMTKADGQVNLAIQQGVIKPTGKLGKASHWVKSKTGIYKVQKALLKGPRGAKALRMAKVGMKGTWMFAALEGVFELANIGKAYKRDRADGNRQLVKSGTKVAASVGGYALGSAAAGAAVGSIFPGIGTVVGAIVGAVGGIIGGWIAGKVAEKATKKVLGESQTLDKTEADFAKDNELKAEAQKVSENPEEQKALLTEIVQMSQENGGIDDQSTLDAYEKILNSRQAELGLGESGQEGAGSIVDTGNSLMQSQFQYDDELQSLLLGLGSIAKLNKVA